VQAGSGAPDFSKGDVRVKESSSKIGLRVECKTTSHKSYSLSIDTFRKIQSEAFAGGMEIPVMQIEYQGQQGMSKKLAVVEWATFLEMYNQYDPEG
jgi:hypothetical protein